MRRAEIAVVLGHSSGAVLALLSTGAGVPMSHLVVSEPPLLFGAEEPPDDLAERCRLWSTRGSRRRLW